MDFYITQAWKSIFQGKNENIQKVYSNRLVNLFTVRFLYLIVRPWDCPQNRETWEVCSWMGGGVSNALTNLCMALYCYENSVQKYKNKEQKYNEKFNKAMHKFVRVLDKYGWWGGYVCSLSEFQIRLFPILRSRPCSSARLVFTHVAISSSLMLLFQGHVAKKCVIIGCTYVWSSSEILGIKLIDSEAMRARGIIIITWAWMGSESIAHEAEGRIGYWLRGHEGERNNIVLVKSN